MVLSASSSLLALAATSTGIVYPLSADTSSFSEVGRAIIPLPDKSLSITDKLMSFQPLN